MAVVVVGVLAIIVAALAIGRKGEGKGESYCDIRLLALALVVAGSRRLKSDLDEPLLMGEPHLRRWSLPLLRAMGPAITVSSTAREVRLGTAPTFSTEPTSRHACDKLQEAIHTLSQSRVSCLKRPCRSASRPVLCVYLLRTGATPRPW